MEKMTHSKTKKKKKRSGLNYPTGYSGPTSRLSPGMQKVFWGIGFFNQAELSLVTDEVIGKTYSKAIAQDVPNYLEFDGQSYPAVAGPTHVSTKGGDTSTSLGF